MNGIHEVTGSIPVWSTIFSFDPQAAASTEEPERLRRFDQSDFPPNAMPSGKNSRWKPLPLLE